ncbi:MAG: metallophosphoesterase family protein [Actinomycetota bacterium]
MNNTWKRIVLRLALLAALLFAAFQTIAPETFHFRAADVVIQLSPDIPGGHLALSLGPFGDLSWKTHDTPLDVNVRFLIRPSATSFPRPSEFNDLRFAFLLRKVPWLLLTGALVGALLVGTFGRFLRPVLISMGGVGAAAAILVGITAFTFNANALSNPRYRGPIADAPRVLELLREVQHDWSGVQKNINRAVEGLERLHDQIITPGPVENPHTIRFLLVSDVHNNPIGLLIAKQLAERFNVDAILNAGDITDRGTALEGEVFARFANFGIPDIVTPGNHEDQASIQRIEQVPKVTVLGVGTGDTASIDGITILGDADPNASSVSSDPSNKTAEEQIPLRCQALGISYLGIKPQILMVHDPRQGQCAADAARAAGNPLVFVWGHTHKQAYEVNGSVIGISDGTSGANGIKSPVQSPFGFGLLEFDGDTKLPVTACLFAFDDPSRLREASCHIISMSQGGFSAGTPSPAASP